MRALVPVLLGLLLVPLLAPVGLASTANGVPCQSDVAPLAATGTASGHAAPGEIDDYNIELRAHDILTVAAAFSQANLHTVTIRLSSWIDRATCQTVCESGEVLVCQPRASGTHTISIIGRGLASTYTFAWAKVSLPEKITVPP